MVFEAYKNITVLMVLVEVVLIAVTVNAKPHIAIYTTLASIFIVGQYIWVGVPLFAWHVSACLGLVYFVSGNSSSIHRANRQLKLFFVWIAFYFAYNLFISLPMWAMLHLYALPEQAIGTSTQRMISQTLYLIFQIGLFSFGIYAACKINVQQLIKFFVQFAAVIAYLAITQFSIFVSTGLDIFPIVGSDNTVRSTFILGESFRATSIMGEPKHLGIFMAFGFSVYYIARIFSIPVGRYSLHIPVAIAIALLISFSTTGIVISISSVFLLIAVNARNVRKSDFMFLFLLLPFAIFHYVQSDDAVLAATLEQVGRIALERQDESVRDFLLDNPMLAILGTGVGNIHNYSVSYLPSEFPLFRDRGYKGNSGLIYILGDSGIIGLAVFLGAHLFAIFALSRSRSRETRVDNTVARAILALLFISLFNFMLRYNAVHFFISGFALVALSRSQMSENLRLPANPTTIRGTS